jgi:hypothetical protein
MQPKAQPAGDIKALTPPGTTVHISHDTNSQNLHRLPQHTMMHLSSHHGGGHLHPPSHIYLDTCIAYTCARYTVHLSVHLLARALTQAATSPLCTGPTTPASHRQQASYPIRNLARGHTTSTNTTKSAQQQPSTNERLLVSLSSTGMVLANSSRADDSLLCPGSTSTTTTRSDKTCSVTYLTTSASAQQQHPQQCRNKPCTCQCMAPIPWTGITPCHASTLPLMPAHHALSQHDVWYNARI